MFSSDRSPKPPVPARSGAVIARRELLLWRVKEALVPALLIACSAPAQAIEGYVLGISGEADTAKGRAVSGFADVGITKDTWVSAALGRTSTDGALGRLDTVYADLSLEHAFGAAGIRLGAAYWGDEDLLDSNDLRGALFVRGDAGSLSLDYERRDFAFTFVPPLEPDTTRTARFSANGIGGSARLNAADRLSLFVNGMSYDYSRDIRIQQDIDSLRLLGRSRLSLVNSLIDYRVSGGVSFEIGKGVLDLSLSRWQTAVDGGHVNSVSAGLTVPVSGALDVDIRLAYDDVENFGDTVALAITLLYFGS